VKPCWLSRFGIPQHASLVYGYEPLYPIPLTDHCRKGESNSDISISMYVDHLHLLGRCSARRSQNEQFEFSLLQASRAEDAFVTHSGTGNMASSSRHASYRSLCGLAEASAVRDCVGLRQAMRQLTLQAAARRQSECNKNKVQ
jgi:hypothetical protein